VLIGIEVLWLTSKFLFWREQRYLAQCTWI